MPSGRLLLQLDQGYLPPGLRQAFSDGKRQRLENLLEEVVASLALYAQSEKARRLEDERRRLAAAEAEKARMAAERRRRRDAKRLELLDLQLVRVERAEQVESAPRTRADNGDYITLTV